MQVIKFNLDDRLNIKDEVSLCLGYFDGLHLGHQALINQSVKSSYKSALLTFEFNDNITLKNKAFITSLQDKEDILNSLGIDYLFVLKFDENVKNLTPAQFIDRVIMNLHAKELVIGEDYHFGAKASGDYDTLVKLSNSRYKVIKVAELNDDGEKIGTSKIIPLIENGDIIKVNRELGRYYKISSIVNKGYEFGNTHKVPTANLPLNGYVKPKNGVYATFIKINDKIYESMTNVGIHPTINELTEPVIEVNIFDFAQDIYNQKVELYFVDFVRPEQKFISIDELYKQLSKDKITCKNILENELTKVSKIIPFLGVNNFLFNQDFDTIINEYQIKKEDIALLGTSFECDYHLYEIVIDNLKLYFRKDTKKLVEIDVSTKEYGAMPNGLMIGMKMKEAFEKDSSLTNTDLEGVYYSNNGYLIIPNHTEDEIGNIIIFEREFFNHLCFSEQERERRDSLLIDKMIELTSLYFKKPSDMKIANSLVKLFSMNIDVTAHFILSLDKQSIIQLNFILNRLIDDNKYFKEYATDEEESLKTLISQINKMMK